MTKSKPFYPKLINEEYILAVGEVCGQTKDSIFAANPFGWIRIKTNLPSEVLNQIEKALNLKELFEKYSRMQHPNLPIGIVRNIIVLDEAPSSRLPYEIISDDLID